MASTTPTHATQPLKPRTLRTMASSASGPDGRLHFELSIAPSELRTCGGCAKVLFEPRHAQPHSCQSDCAHAAKAQPKQRPRESTTAPGKKRRAHRPRTQPGLTRAPNDAKRPLPKPIGAARTSPAVRKLPTPMKPEPPRTVPLTLDEFRKHLTTPEQTRAPPSQHEHFRMLSSSPEPFRTEPSSAESAPQPLSLSETFRIIPNATKSFRSVTTSPEQFRTVTSSPEPLLRVNPTTKTSPRQSRDVSDSILRLARELRAHRQPVGVRRTKETVVSQPAKPATGFTADVLFAAGSAFLRSPHSNKNMQNAGPSGLLDRQFERAMQRKKARVLEAENLSSGRKERVTLKESPNSSGLHRVRTKAAARATRS